MIGSNPSRGDPLLVSPGELILSGTSEGLWPIVFLALPVGTLLLPAFAHVLEVLAIVRVAESISRLATSIVRVGLTTVAGLAATEKAFRNMIDGCQVGMSSFVSDPQVDQAGFGLIIVMLTVRDGFES